MECPLDVQRAIYGDKGGPPMIIPGGEEDERLKNLHMYRRQRKRRKTAAESPNARCNSVRVRTDPKSDEIANQSYEQFVMTMRQRNGSVVKSDSLSAGVLPGDFPPDLAYRALAAYALLRTLSVPLRLSPFTPNVFLRALYLPYPNKVTGQIHVNLLRVLLPNLQLGYYYKPKGSPGAIGVVKKRSVDSIRYPLRAGDNLTFLDRSSWPLFYDDYCHLTADRLWSSMHDEELHLDFRNVGMQPVGVKPQSDLFPDDATDDYHGDYEDADYHEQGPAKPETHREAEFPFQPYPHWSGYTPNPTPNISRQQPQRGTVSKPLTSPTGIELNDNENETNTRRPTTVEQSSQSARQMSFPKSNTTAESRQRSSSRTQVQNILIDSENEGEASDSEYDTETDEELVVWTPPSKQKKRKRAMAAKGRNKKQPSTVKTKESSSQQDAVRKLQPKALTSAPIINTLASSSLPTQSSLSQQPKETKLPKSQPVSRGPKKRMTTATKGVVVGEPKSRLMKSTGKGPSSSGTFLPKAIIDAIRAEPGLAKSSTLPSKSTHTRKSIHASKAPVISTVSRIKKRPSDFASKVIDVESPPAVGSLIRPGATSCTGTNSKNGELPRILSMSSTYNDTSVATPSHPMTDDSSVSSNSKSILKESNDDCKATTPSSNMSSSKVLSVSVAQTSLIRKTNSSEIADLVDSKKVVQPTTTSDATKTNVEVHSSAAASGSTEDEPIIHASTDAGAPQTTHSSKKSSETADNVSPPTKSSSASLSPLASLDSHRDVHNSSNQASSTSVLKSSEAKNLAEVCSSEKQFSSAPQNSDHSSSTTTLLADKAAVIRVERRKSGLPIKPKLVNTNQIDSGSQKHHLDNWGAAKNNPIDQASNDPHKKNTVPAKSKNGGSSIPSLTEARPTSTPASGVKRPRGRPRKLPLHDHGTVADSTQTARKRKQRRKIETPGPHTSSSHKNVSHGSHQAIHHHPPIHMQVKHEMLNTGGVQARYPEVWLPPFAEFPRPMANPFPENAFSSASNGRGSMFFGSAPHAQYMFSQQQYGIPGAIFGSARGMPNPMQYKLALPLAMGKGVFPNVPSSSHPIVDSRISQPAKPKSFEVSSDIADQLKNFITIGSTPTSEPTSTADTTAKVPGKPGNDYSRFRSTGRSEFKQGVDFENWPQFRPLITMRSGVPYYRLPVREKIEILEFLIDELLSVEVIAAEFSKRQAMTECFEFPYGSWPTEAEFDSLENDDECGVCHGEGELLCCDGCVGSYHRACLDMSMTQALPEGKWLCPECRLVDPAHFGTLRGGRKASLDWFSLRDIHAATSLASEAQGGDEQIGAGTIDGKNEANCSDAAGKINAVNDEASAEPKMSCDEAMAASSEEKPVKSEAKLALAELDTTLPEPNAANAEGRTAMAELSTVHEEAKTAVARLDKVQETTVSDGADTNADIHEAKIAPSECAPTRQITLDEEVNPTSADLNTARQETKTAPNELITAKAKAKAEAEAITALTGPNTAEVKANTVLADKNTGNSEEKTILDERKAMHGGIKDSLSEMRTVEDKILPQKEVQEPMEMKVVMDRSNSGDLASGTVFNGDSERDPKSESHGKNDKQNEEQLSGASASVALAPEETNASDVITHAKKSLHGQSNLQEDSSTLHQSNTKESNIDSEFLVVHGFVFSRSDKAFEATSPILQQGHVPLSKGKLAEIFSSIGSKLASAWPFRQIPTDHSVNSNHFPNVKVYLAALDSCDPSFYANRYQRAPLPSYMRAGVGSQESSLVLSEYESECGQSSTYRLTEVLIKDMTYDQHIANRLNKTLTLFDPYQMVKGYLLKLENTLRKACLLDEFWETGRTKARCEVWINSVRQSQSINRLALLFLKLVDKIHPRAFLDGWVHNPLSKVSENTSTIRDRSYLPLPKDWSIKSELRKRLWERAPLSSFLGLLVAEGCSLEETFSGVRIDTGRLVTVTRSKRKQNQSSKNSNTAESEEARNLSNSNVNVSIRNNSSEEWTSVDPNVQNATAKSQGLQQESKRLPVSRVDQSSTMNGQDENSQQESKRLPGTNVEQSVQNFTTKTQDGLQQEPKGLPGSSVDQNVTANSQDDSQQEHTKGLPGSSVDQDVTANSQDGSQQEPKGMQGSSVGQNVTANSQEGSQQEPKGLPGSSVDQNVTVNSQGGLQQDPKGWPGSNVGQNVTANRQEILQQEPKALPGRSIGQNASSQEGSQQKPKALPGTLIDAVVGTGDNEENGGVPLGCIQTKTDVTFDTPSPSCDIDPKNAKVPSSDAAKAKAKAKVSKKQKNSKSKRRTRRSGRIQTRHTSDLGEQQARPNLSELSDAGTMYQGATDIFVEDQKKARITELEKLAKGSFQKPINWPLAGRIPFGTFGNLPPREMRRLARNAGTVKASHVEYSTSHEVGQVCLAHMWRKATAESVGLEELLFQIRIFESFLDKPAIHSCESLARRVSGSKAHVQKVIQCSQADPSTGVIYHFVVNKNRQKGCWISAESVELSSLMLEKVGRREKQLGKFLTRMRAKAAEELRLAQLKREAEAARKAAELSKRKAEAAAKKRAEMAAAKKRAEILAAKKAAEATKKHAEALGAKTRRSPMVQASVSASQRSPTHQSSTPTLSAATVQKADLSDIEKSQWKEELRLTLIQHESDIQQLIQRSLLSGIFSIQESHLEGIRQKNMPRLSRAAEALKRCQVLNMTETELRSLLLAGEKRVMTAVTNTQRISKSKLSAVRNRSSQEALGANVSLRAHAPRSSPAPASSSFPEDSKWAHQSAGNVLTGVVGNNLSSNKDSPANATGFQRASSGSANNAAQLYLQSHFSGNLSSQKSGHVQSSEKRMQHQGGNHSEIGNTPSTESARDGGNYMSAIRKPSQQDMAGLRKTEAWRYSDNSYVSGAASTAGLPGAFIHQGGRYESRGQEQQFATHRRAKVSTSANLDSTSVSYQAGEHSRREPLIASTSGTNSLARQSALLKSMQQPRQSPTRQQFQNFDFDQFEQFELEEFEPRPMTAATMIGQDGAVRRRPAEDIMPRPIEEMVTIQTPDGQYHQHSQPVPQVQSYQAQHYQQLQRLQQQQHRTNHHVQPQFQLNQNQHPQQARQYLQQQQQQLIQQQHIQQQQQQQQQQMRQQQQQQQQFQFPYQQMQRNQRYG